MGAGVLSADRPAGGPGSSPGGDASARLGGEARPRPAEVLVRGSHVSRVRHRESYSDLIRDEVDE